MLRLPPQHKLHATFLQLLHCVLQPRLPKHHVTAMLRNTQNTSNQPLHCDLRRAQPVPAAHTSCPSPPAAATLPAKNVRFRAPASSPKQTRYSQHFPRSSLPIVIAPLCHHFPRSSLPSVTTSLSHHFPRSPLPFVTTALGSSLPLVTTSLSHHPSPPPFVITLRHHPSSPPFVITSLSHHPSFPSLM